MSVNVFMTCKSQFMYLFQHIYADVERKSKFSLERRIIIIHEIIH